jgi:hypothetical protein
MRCLACQRITKIKQDFIISNIPEISQECTIELITMTASGSAQSAAEGFNHIAPQKFHRVFGIHLHLTRLAANA